MQSRCRNRQGVFKDMRYTQRITEICEKQENIVAEPGPTGKLWHPNRNNGRARSAGKGYILCT